MASVTRASQGLTNVAGEMLLSKSAIDEGAIRVVGRVTEYMSPAEATAFVATYNSKLMRFIIRLWWLAYRFQRWRGIIPAITEASWE